MMIAAGCGSDAGTRSSHASLGCARRVFPVALITALSLWSAFAAPVAQAKSFYPYLGQLSGASFPNSVAVDDLGSEVLVGDSANSAVDVFQGGSEVATWNGSATSVAPCTGPGSFGSSSVHVAVNQSTGDIYVADASDGVVDVLDASGGCLGQLTDSTGTAPFSFSEPETVAVDQANGNIYVGDAGSGNVDIFDATGRFTGTLPGVNVQGHPSVDIATDDHNNQLLIAPGDDFLGNNVNVYDLATGAYLTTWAFGSAGNTSVAVDEATGNVFAAIGQTYASNAQTVEELDGTGTVVGTMTGTPSGSFSFLTGIGVDPATGEIYVVDGGASTVDIFGQSVVVPDVTTMAASGVQLNSGTLTGTVNPDGQPVTSCQFEYGTTPAYGQSIPCAQSTAQIGDGNSPVPVTADLSGLQPNTLYHYRLDAGNSNGSNTGQDQPLFTTTGQFGLQTSGPNPVSATVSNSASPSDPTLANPADLDTQAGSHPFDVTTSFRVNVDSQGNLPPRLAPKDFFVNIPPGLVGSATAAPQCPMVDLTSYEQTTATPSGCPTDTQVGVIRVIINNNNADGPVPYGSLIPVYNMVPSAGAPAELAFVLLDVAQPVVFKVRSDGDYGLTAEIPRLTELLNPTGSVMTLWGVPADPAHDSQRFLPTNGLSGGPPGDANGNPLPAGGPDTPFITLPTKCGASPLQMSVSTDSWVNSGRLAADGMPDLADPAWQTRSVPMFPDGITGCDKLSFNPSMSVALDTQKPDSPAGVNFDLQVPQDLNPGDLATPALRNSTVTLPKGLVVSPSSANGLEGCTDAEIALDSISPATCPNASQVATVTIHTPLLPDPLTGQVFLGTPECSPCSNADAQDGKMLRGYIQAQGDGVIVKLPGYFSADPKTGQLTAHFDNNPQLPFSDLQIDFKGGPRGLVATPPTCGTFTTTADFQPWSSPDSGPDATPSSSFDVSGCGNPNTFSPSFTAGTANPQAGAYSPFAVEFSRTDADQPFSGLSVKLPPGALADLNGVPLCSNSEANAGTCPAGSQVGTATVASGPGSEPLWIPQPGDPQPKVFLTGPYEGAPYGLVVETPAIAGPFNLGTVVVRQALHIDPTTAQVTAVSDPFPSILDGIPLQIRAVNVMLNRPHFTLNPTSCDVMQIAGTLTSTLGINAPVNSRFQVGGCAGLGFSPKLRMQLTGRGRTKSGDHPNLISTLTQKGGQANLHNVRVALPLSLALDPNNSQHVCSYATAQAVQGGAVGCPSSTIVGHATAVTPLLSQPLSGPVYLVQGIRFQNGQPIHTLPSLLIPLRGQIALDLRAQSSVSGGKLVTTFPTVPDAPVSKFTLQINGGRRGILVITGRGRSICGSPQVTQADLVAQNGKAQYPNIKMRTPCRRVRHHSNRHSHRHNRRHK